jgi:rSAM/selenodomain-associated transferase 1
MNALIIFIKNPTKGKVKTRIAATTGDEEALHIYLQLLDFTRHLTTKIDCQRFLFYSDVVEKNDDWNNDFFEKNTQYGDGLGDRMKNAFEFIFSKNIKKALIIGSDCAELNEKIIHDAFEALDQHDFVLGPADDGGYYLLGMNAFSPTVFDHITWSSAEVLSKTIENIAFLNKKHFLLPVLSDTDTEEDWLRVKHLCV